MKRPIEITLLCAALLFGSAASRAQDSADIAAPTAAPAAPDTSGAPAAPAPTPVDKDKGVHVKIDLHAEEDGNGGKAMIDIDTDADDEDDGPVGRAIRKGVAGFLEEHVLTSEDLDAQDRAEVQKAIAELRGEVEREAKDVEKEIAEAGREIDREIARSGKKHRVIINESGESDSDDDDGFGAFQAIVAIVGIIFTLGMPIIIIAAVLYSSYRKRRLAHDTINQYLASGKEIPPEIMQNLFKEAGTVTPPRTNFQKGTLNSGIGLGMVIGFNIIDVGFLAAIGFIFLFVGLAQLLIWKLEQGKTGDKLQG